MNYQQLGGYATNRKRWRWMPGMLVRGFDPTTKNPAWMRLREFHSSMSLTAQAEQLLQPWPDFSDPATLGCLLALVRQENDDPRLHCRLRANKFRVFSGVTPVGRWVDSEAKALIDGLMVCEHH